MLLLKLYLIFFAFFYLNLIRKYLIKNGKCLGMFHDWRELPRASHSIVGGSIRHECHKCSAEKIEYWSAF